MKTEFTRQFGVEHPIMQGGMQYVGFGAQVAAVSNAGGLRTITGLTQRTPGDLANDFARCKDIANKPFAVNVTFLPTVNAPDCGEIIRSSSTVVSK